MHDLLEGSDLLSVDLHDDWRWILDSLEDLLSSLESSSNHKNSIVISS